MTDPLPRRIAWFAPWTWKRRWKIIGAGVLVVVAYPLSYGPAFGLLASGWITPQMFDAIYQPLWTTARKCGFSGWLLWYGTLFLRN
ncbi:MAG: hypothetical protein Q8K78_10355 [Planctomycetaceae bacterium]|nr:hypothetical protein [Planctomycetaceae bacterium]